MTPSLRLPGLLDTGYVTEHLAAVRDGPMNLYVVLGPAGLVCVDAGWRRAGVARGFDALHLAMADVTAVFLTHRHWDHARAARHYPNAEVFVGARETASPSWTPVRDGETLAAGGLRVQVMETPGHTPGSVCYVIDDRYLFTGDTLRLRRGRAAPFWPWLIGRREPMDASIRRLARLDGVEYLLTAHTGVTRDAPAAFCNWRNPEGHPSRGGTAQFPSNG